MSHRKTYRRFGRLARLLLAAVAALAVMPLAALDLTQKIDVAGANITVKELFRRIEVQTGYTFAFNKSAFDTSKRVELPAGAAEVGDILNAVLRDSGFSYILNDKHIIILPSREEQSGVKRSARRSPRAAAQPVPAGEQRSAPVQYASQTVNPPSAQAAAAEKPATQIDLPVVRADEVYMEVVDNSVYMVIPGQQVIEMPGIEPDRYTKSSEPVLSLGDRVPNVPRSPRWALKTNLLADATTTMSLGVELRVSPKNTIELTGYYNPWSWSDNRKWKSIAVQPEFRHWICDPFAGHFIGAHVQWAHYNFSGLPFGGMKNHRYQGDLFGAGFSYGYSWYVGRRWALEATVGAGYNYLEYEKFDCGVCGARFGRQNHHYFGITKLGLNLSFLIK